MRTLGTIALTLAMALSTAVAADWWQFQGPDRNGISPETGLARSWGPEGPKVLWTIPVGDGFGGASIRDGRVYMLDRIVEKADVLRCLDLATGEEVWRYEYEAPGVTQKDFPGSRAQVVVDEKYVYAVGPFGHFHVVDRQNGNVVWKAHLLEDFGGRKPNWAVAQSPLLYGDTVIAAPLSRQVGVVAFSRETGEVVWKSESVGVMQYVSPVLATVDGVDTVVVVANASQRGTNVTGVDARTGEVLWTFDGWSCGIPIPCPTPIGDGRFFVTGGYNAGCAMFRVSRNGEAWNVEPLFANRNCNSQIHNALLYDGYLYANSNQNGFGLTCLDLEGNTQWKTGGNPDFDMGNLLIADGLIFALSKDGSLRLIEATPAGYKELASARLLGGSTIWAPMALTDGKLIIRDRQQMRCVDVSAAGNQ